MALVCAYNPYKEHLKELVKAIQLYSKTYNNFRLIGDYIAEVDETKMTSFYWINELRNLINEPTYFKSSLNSLCMYLSQITSTVLREHCF